MTIRSHRMAVSRSALALLSHRRRVVCKGLLLGAATLLPSSCDSSPENAVVDVSLFNYLNRPIFDVLLNGKDIGGSLARGFNGANSSMIGERITLGPQVITWRLDGPEGMPWSGETVCAKNTPTLAEMPKGVTWRSPSARIGAANSAACAV